MKNPFSQKKVYQPDLKLKNHWLYALAALCVFLLLWNVSRIEKQPHPLQQDMITAAHRTQEIFASLYAKKRTQYHS